MDGILLASHCLDRPFSNFSFVEQFAGDCIALRRIFSQARRNNCHTLLVEEIEDAEDIRQEDADLAAHPDVGPLNTSRTYRLSFFQLPYSATINPPELDDDNFIGYAIVRIVTSTSGWSEAWVYESVIKPERITNNFIRRAPHWQCRILGRALSIQGYLYAQQNGKTNCCAHVAIRCAASAFSATGDVQYHEMNRLIGGYTGSGLTTREMVKILEHAGATCYVGCFDTTQADSLASRLPFQKFIYGSIESGYPAIIVFGVSGHGEYHAIPAIGHTFNQDNWVPRAERSYFSIGEKIQYIPSESWLSMFICHDDNFGSNYCIPRHYLHTGGEEICEKCRDGVDDETHQACVCYVIGTLPGSVRVDPIAAEAIGAQYLFELKDHIPHADNEWLARMRQSVSHNKLVLRPILVTPDEYLGHLDSIRDWTGNRLAQTVITALEDILVDDWYWLVELSLAELFAANMRKVGEVLIRATIAHDPEHLFDSFVLSRLPRYFVLYDENTTNFAFIPSGLNDHVELFGQEERLN